MNNDSVIPAYIQALLRWAMTGVGTYLVQKGFVTDSQAPEIVGAALSVAAIVWSIINKIGRAHV